MRVPKEKYLELTNPMISHINVGAGKDITIAELALLISKVVGFEGELIFDDTKPDGVYRKLLDSSKVFSLGWRPSISLEDGIAMAYNDFLNNKDSLRIK